MSDIWDGLFESTSLNTDPNATLKAAPSKAVIVEPIAKTAPAPSNAPKRTRKSVKSVTATPVPETPAEPAVDVSIFFGSEETDDIGQAGVTAISQAKIAEQATNGDNDAEGCDPFAEEGDTIPTSPTITPISVTAMPIPEAGAPATPKRRRGRPVGSKKKTVTAEQYVDQMDKVTKGDPLAAPNFPEPTAKTTNFSMETNDRSGEATSAEPMPKEIELLVRSVTRIVLEELCAAFARQARK